MLLNKQSVLYRTLARALSMQRPHNSEGTQRLTAWLQANVPAHARVSVDGAGNLHVDTRSAPHHRTLFVSHVDTVHRKPGPNKIHKTPTHWHAKGAPLGADDGAGVAMLMHLLHSGVAAYYVFTQGEECGGIGATFLADKHAALLSEFDRAIAFDRRGVDSVITHQGYGRCCSDDFADALSDALNQDPRLMYLPDSTGVYTDTAEFTGIIPECTNISVGYEHEHSDRECLSLSHFVALAERVVQIDWDGLPTHRDPSVKESKWGDLGAYNTWDYSWDYGAGATSVSLTDWGLATSVNLSSPYSRWHLVEDDNEPLRENLRCAIYDAIKGDKQWLVELMAECVYPDDPAMAIKFIDRKKITDEFLEVALEDVDAFDPDTVMCYMFDQVHKPH